MTAWLADRTKTTGVKCGLSRNAHTPEVFVPHGNAPLPETGRMRLARCIVDDVGRCVEAPHLVQQPASQSLSHRSRAVGHLQLFVHVL